MVEGSSRVHRHRPFAAGSLCGFFVTSRGISRNTIINEKVPSLPPRPRAKVRRFEPEPSGSWARVGRRERAFACATANASPARHARARRPRLAYRALLLEAAHFSREISGCTLRKPLWECGLRHDWVVPEGYEEARLLPGVCSTRRRRVRGARLRRRCACRSDSRAACLPP